MRRRHVASDHSPPSRRAAGRPAVGVGRRRASSRRWRYADGALSATPELDAVRLTLGRMSRVAETPSRRFGSTRRCTRDREGCRSRADRSGGIVYARSGRSAPAACGESVRGPALSWSRPPDDPAGRDHLHGRPDYGPDQGAIHCSISDTAVARRRRTTCCRRRTPSCVRRCRAGAAPPRSSTFRRRAAPRSTEYTAELEREGELPPAAEQRLSTCSRARWRWRHGARGDFAYLRRRSARRLATEWVAREVIEKRTRRRGRGVPAAFSARRRRHPELVVRRPLARSARADPGRCGVRLPGQTRPTSRATLQGR